MNIRIIRDPACLLIVAVLSLGAGALTNQYREKPLPLRYQPRAARLDQVVKKILPSGITPASAKTTTSPPAVTPPPAAAVQKSASSPVVEHMALDEFHDFVEQKKGLVLDARAKKEYETAHVPGAISLPEDDFEKAYAALKANFEADKSQPIAIYCTGFACNASTLVGQALARLGYANVSVFHGGMQRWVGANLPTEKSQ
jgi:rhodanese-related sulfurtransferase